MSVNEDNVRRGTLPAMQHLEHPRILPIGQDYFGNDRRLSLIPRFMGPNIAERVNQPGKNDDAHFTNGFVFNYSYDNPNNTMHHIDRYKKPVQPVFYRGVPVPPPVPPPIQKPKPKPKPKSKPVSNLVEVLDPVTPIMEEPTVVNSTSKPSTTTTTPSTTTNTTTPATTTTTKKTMTANPTKWFSLDGSGDNILLDGKYITREGFEKFKSANPNFNYSQKPDSVGRVYEDGGMIKRADGSYSRRGLWDNIRANKGSGKKPTKEMLRQEKKIKSQYENGGMIEMEDGGLFFEF